VRLGLALPHYDTSLAGAPVTWEGIRSAAGLAEKGGFSSVWVSDHLFLDWSKYGGPPDVQGAFECWTTTTALAASTDRLRIGTLVLNNDLRHPGLVAKMAATLDALSGGRLELGLGAGWYEPEYAAAGIALAQARERIARLGEATEIVTRLLTGEELDFHGSFYSVNGALVRPGPVQKPRPPVWLGGKGDRLLRAAAASADGWNFSWVGSLESYRERARAADAACEQTGRDPATLRRSVGAYVLCGRNDRDVKRRLERLAERGWPRPLPDGKDSARSAIAGTPGEVLEALGRLGELGVEEVVAGLGTVPFEVTDLSDVELVGVEVASALR